MREITVHVCDACMSFLLQVDRCSFDMTFQLSMPNIAKWLNDIVQAFDTWLDKTQLGEDASTSSLQ